VGTGVSGHDIAADFLKNGANVTLCQRGRTYVLSQKNAIPVLDALYVGVDRLPVEVADTLANSVPIPVARVMALRRAQELAELDRELLEGLRKVGFNLSNDIPGLSNYELIMTRAGGVYLDVGTSQLIVDGAIKLKVGEIDRFTETGLVFRDGDTLEADMVVFATGFGDGKRDMRAVFGEEMVAHVKDSWGIDDEGEMKGIWRPSGHEGFWVAMGNLPMCRYYSKRLALQIKAIEVGLYNSRPSEVGGRPVEHLSA